MVGNIQDPFPAVPCALKHCLPHGSDAEAFTALSQHKRRIGFQDWVRYSRTASLTVSSETVAKENLLCPLLWCRTGFENIPSTLQHISSCPWLLDAWYWCPSCCRPERFMDGESTSPSNAPQDGHEEVTSFKRAVAFFKTFGSNDARAHAPGLSRVNNPNLYPSTPAYTQRSFDKHHLLVGRTQDIGYHTSEPRRNEGNSKSREYTASLCDVLRVFGAEWIRRLALGTSVPQILPERYFCSLLGLGIRALRNHFRGATPSGFQDIFALIHVVMAASYIVHEGDEDYPWNLFGEEAYQWQDHLFNVIEKGAFTKAMNRLCHPQTSASSSRFIDSTIHNSFLPAEQAMLVRLIFRLSGNRVKKVIEENGDQDRQHSIAETEQLSLPRRVQSNIIIKECTDFLDDFGHAVIVEDIATRQINSSWYIVKHVLGLETLDRNIVWRLQEWKGLEAFRGGVTETQRMLRCGLLHSARDVEITLIWFGKSCSKSPLLLRKYLDVVKHLCDAVMKDLGPHWRSPFYETILGTVLATAAESSRDRRHALQIPPETPFDNFNTDQKASTVTPPASANPPPIIIRNATASSPESVPTSSVQSDDVSYCPDPSCQAAFKGLRRESNLIRHLKTASNHNQDAQLKCSVCQVTFGRADNLQQHVRHIHGLDPGLKS